MTVNEWFENNGDYNAGVILYMHQKGHNANLVSLFLKKESANNYEKLKYELGKFKTADSTLSAPSVKTEIVTTKTSIENKPLPIPPKIDTPHAHYFYRLNQLSIDLHPMAMQQRADFQKAISLKMQLNLLHELEEGKALALCIEIENLFDAIEMAQKVLSHYVKHKVVLDIESYDFKDMTPDQRYVRLKNKRSSIAKLKARIKAYKKELSAELPIKRKTKLQTQIQRSSANLLKQEHEVQELINYMNDRQDSGD